MRIDDSLKNLFRKIFAPTKTDTPTLDSDQVDPKNFYNQNVWDPNWTNIASLQTEQDLLSRYLDYEAMDDIDIFSSALNVYAEDVSQPNYDIQLAVWTKTEDKDVATIAQKLWRRIGIEDSVYDITRSLCKYGNDFERLKIDAENKCIIGLDFVSPSQMRRYEYRDDINFVFSPPASFSVYNDKDLVDRVNGGDMVDGSNLFFDFWEILHFRLRHKNRGVKYGFGVMESCRWAWKRLAALENISTIYKMTRNPGRLAFFVNTGTLPPQAQLSYVNKLRQGIKKKKFINPNTGEIEFRNHYLSYDEDIWLPLREGKDNTRIEAASGPDFDAQALMEYFLKRIFAGLQIPRAYLTYEEEANGKNLLSHEDARFARVVMRIQRQERMVFNLIMMVELSLQGIDPFSVNFETLMATPSHIYELAQMELESTRASLASSLNDFVSRHWILTNIFGFSDTEIEKMMGEREVESYNAVKDMSAAIPGLGTLDDKVLEGYFAETDVASAEGGDSMEGFALPPELVLNPNAEIDANVKAMGDNILAGKGGVPEGFTFKPKKKSSIISVNPFAVDVKRPSNIMTIPAIKKEDLDRYLFDGNKKIEKKLTLELEKILQENKKMVAEIRKSTQFMKEVSDSIGYRTKKGMFDL